MKALIVVAVVVCPAIAYGQTTYTNADLTRFQVPGAYTNEDLRALGPAPVVKVAPLAEPFVFTPPAAADAWQERYDEIALTRGVLEAELRFELEQIDYSESAFAGDPQEIGPRAGYRARVIPFVLEVRKRIALLDAEIEAFEDRARRAGVLLDRRGR